MLEKVEIECKSNKKMYASLLFLILPLIFTATSNTYKLPPNFYRPEIENSYLENIAESKRL
jgi:hypothetical protein